MLRVENIVFGYPGGSWRLDDISFTLAAGELLGIVGPNGAGKSTLLRIAAGLLAPASGRVRLGDGILSPRHDRRAVARQLAYLPQAVASDYDYGVAELVALGRYPHQSGMGFLSEYDRRVVDRCLRQAELEELRGRTLSQLSGGERQRVYLASVLAQEPRFLLLDEPTSALDLHHQIAFFRLLRELAEAGVGIAVVTHEMNLAALYCHKLLMLAGGQPASHGAPAEVLTVANIARVYGPEVLVTRHPEQDLPVVLPHLPNGR